MSKNPYTLTPTAIAIYKQWLKRGKAEAPRTYLGASIVGNPCDYYLWLYFHGVIMDSFDGRMYRLFDRGKREEAVFANDLRSIGCEVKEFDNNGSQFAVSDFGGHFSGHLDGVCRGLAEAPTKWHVVEYKTHSDASFKKLCKEGVAQAKPMHYAQMTAYMGKTGIEDALYVAVNKDNDELYTERLKLSKADYDSIMERAKRIITSSSADKCANRPDDFRCKGCPCSSVCWDRSTVINTAIPFSCRTCCHATADIEHDGAQWTCALGHSCSTKREACSDYLVLPALVNGDIVDGSADAINYTDGDHAFTIRKGVANAEQMKLVDAAKASDVDDAKAVIPNAKVIESNHLEMKYRAPEYYEAFNGPVADMKSWMSAEMSYMDWSTPVSTEEMDGKKYYEYDCSGYRSLVIINGTTGKIMTDEPPF